MRVKCEVRSVLSWVTGTTAVQGTAVVVAEDERAWRGGRRELLSRLHVVSWTPTARRRSTRKRVVVRCSGGVGAAQ